MSIVTAQDVRDHLEGYGIGNADELISDDWIEDEIDNTVVPYVEDRCRTSLSGPKTITEYYSGGGDDNLILNRRNILKVTSIILVSGGDVLGVVNIASMELIAGAGILKVKSGLSEFFNYRVFPKGHNNIKVTYTFDGSANKDLATAVKKLACISVFDNLEGRTGGGENLSVQGVSRSYGNMGKWTNIRKRLNQQATAIMRRYQTAVVGA